MTGYVLYSYTAANGTTYTTNEPATPVNDIVEGLLTVTPGGGPTACETGVQTATLSGVAGFGDWS